MISRLALIFPLLFSFISFVLILLALSTGSNNGFMEDYAIARLNTSMLGYNILETESDSSTNEDDDGNFLDEISDKWDTITGDIKDEVNEIASDAIEELGLSEWYSIHITGTCKGYFRPNATAVSPELNITNCTGLSAHHRFDLNKILNSELSLGPLDFALSDLKWPNKIDSALDTFNQAFYSLFILYVFSAVFSGLATLACVAAFFLYKRRSIISVNFLFAVFAATCILIGSIVITAASRKIVGSINDLGEDIGLSANLGYNFFKLVWVAAGLMAIASLYWTAQFYIMRRQTKVE